MARFILMWVVISSLIGGFVYLTTKRERKDIRKLGWKLIVSGVVGLVVTSLLMSLNNVQGI